jgi:uncharacterized membrane protein
MLELLPISITFATLVKIVLIIAINMFLGYTWYSPKCFQKQWMEAMQWQEGDVCHNQSIVMSNIGALLNSFLLNILLIGFDIRKHQFLSAMMTSAILCGFNAVSSYEYLSTYISIL